MRMLRAVGAWLEARLGLRDTLLHVMRHPIPRGAAGPMGWWYVFGSASMALPRSRTTATRTNPVMTTMLLNVSSISSESFIAAI